MICFHCDNEKDFIEKNILFKVKIKNEEVEVIAPAFVCVKCNKEFLDADQMNILRKLAADEYMKKHKSTLL